MSNQIRLKRGSGSNPTASDLAVGELAIRTDTGVLFTKDSGGSVITVGGGGGIDDGDKGDITVSNSGATFTIDNDVVSFAKMQNIAQNRIIGRTASGTGDPTTLTAANVRSMINVEDGATADQSASEILTLIKTVDGAGSGLDADTLDGHSSAAFIRANAADTASGDITFSGGAGAATIAANSDISFTNGNWSGNHTKIQHHGSRLYIVGGSDGIRFREGASDRWLIDGGGHLDPALDSTYDIGSNSLRVRNGYFDNLYGSGANLTSIPYSALTGTPTIPTNNNQLTNGAGYITSTLTNEQVQDIVGGMVTGNTESGITVTYQDGDGTLDFSVASQTDQNFTTTLKNKLDGIASGATNVTNTNQLTNGAGFLTSVATGNIANNAVDFTKIQDISGNRIIGRTGSSGGNPEQLTAADVRSMINVADGATNVTNNNQITNGRGFITSFTNNFVNSASFNTGNGVLTLGRSGLGNVTVDLDGRFATGTIPTNNNQLSNGRGFITGSGNTTGQARFLENSRTGSAPNYALRAWVNFKGTGSVSVRSSGNVSSITDFGQGNYRVNFSTSMADSNYATTTIGAYDKTNSQAPFIIFSQGGFGSNPIQYNSSGVRCGSTFGDFHIATLMFAR